MNRSVRILPWYAAGLLTLGCHDLRRFDTDGDAAYCGSLVAAVDAHAGLSLPGETARALDAELKLDASELAVDVDATVARPATLTTRDSEGLCAPNPLFSEASIRLIAPLQHDVLSLLDFGEGREHSFMGLVDSTCLGTLVAVVSLMHDRSVELRLIKPAADSGDTPEAHAVDPRNAPGFGVFYLERQNAGCEQGD